LAASPASPSADKPISLRLFIRASVTAGEVICLCKAAKTSLNLRRRTAALALADILEVDVRRVALTVCRREPSWTD
jgi:hypothetical protein